jgi:hypothetical protein
MKISKGNKVTIICKSGTRPCTQEEVDRSSIYPSRVREYCSWDAGQPSEEIDAAQA